MTLCFIDQRGPAISSLGSRKNKEVVGDKGREERKVKVFKKVGQFSKGVSFVRTFI